MLLSLAGDKMGNGRGIRGKTGTYPVLPMKTGQPRVHDMTSLCRLRASLIELHFRHPCLQAGVLICHALHGGRHLVALNSKLLRDLRLLHRLHLAHPYGVLHAAPRDGRALSRRQLQLQLPFLVRRARHRVGARTLSCHQALAKSKCLTVRLNRAARPLHGPGAVAGAAVAPPPLPWRWQLDLLQWKRLAIERVAQRSVLVPLLYLQVFWNDSAVVKVLLTPLARWPVAALPVVLLWRRFPRVRWRGHRWVLPIKYLAGRPHVRHLLVVVMVRPRLSRERVQALWRRGRRAVVAAGMAAVDAALRGACACWSFGGRRDKAVLPLDT
mmetsp:Transcript_32506/g.83051  ORF Transcript_32506/g.83051 Transcript_32506/m.83051 type:complete len:326 (-) Transcript_32506:1026-2003(-)